MENQNTPTPSGTPPGAASAGSGQDPARRFLVQFKMTACEEYSAPTPAAALSDAENSDAPPLGDFTSDEGPEIVAEWDPVAEDWKGTPAALDLSAVPLDVLLHELMKRELAGDCVALVVTPSDLSEYWESDESGATHPASRVPEPDEMRAVRKAFARWQDCGGFTEIMEVCRDAWQEEQARQLDAQEGKGGSK